MLKPVTTTLKKANDTLIVKDPYSDKVIKGVNTYKDDSPLTNAGVDKYLQGPDSTIEPFTVDSVMETVSNIDANNVVADGANDIRNRLSEALFSNGQISISDLGDTIKADLVSGVISTIGLPPELGNVLNNAGEGPPPTLTEALSTLTEVGGNITHMDTTGMMTTINGVDKIIKCDPTDLRGISSILDGMTGSTNLLGIIDIGGLTSTLSTVMKFAIKWNIPHLVDLAMGSVKDYKLRRDMLVKGVLSGARSGNIGVTKYYADKLDDSGVEETVMGYQSTLHNLSETIVSTLIKHYHINEDDSAKSDTRLGDELYDFVTSLRPYTFNTVGNVVDLTVMTTLSPEARRVLGTSSHGLYMFDVKLDTASSIISKYFPGLNNDFLVH